MTTRLMLGLVLMFVATVVRAAPPPPPPPMVDTNGVKAVTVPARLIPAPEEKGKPYKVPATEWKQDPILWGWTCEHPDGTGFTFGGVHQTNDSGMAHTQIRGPSFAPGATEGKQKSEVGGQATNAPWVSIVEDLRKANPLQKRFDRTRALRNACKDALARARHLYFEGKTAEEEGKIVKADVDPAVEKVAKDLAAFIGELKASTGLGEYEAGQVKFALGHLEKAAGQIKPFGALVTPELMATQRCAQIEMEIAGEAFDAEPPPRALSKIAYEPKTKSYVIFGGFHMDYAVNDLWVFDTAKRRWFQRHPEASPEPRFDAHLEPLNDGRVAMWGGCTVTKGYQHAGPARWIYDLAKNVWSADGHEEKLVASDQRTAGYWPPSGPENFMKGARPDAAANEAKLKALPVNTWVRMKTPVPLGGRDWATWVYDTDRDMLYVYAGGHASYCGNDVARYHLATDRWEITDVTEAPLGCWGTNEQYPSGFNFNQRPWCKKHVWNGQAYDPGIKKMVMGSVNDSKVDRYTYLYDPDKADWSGRFRVPDGMNNDGYGMQIRYTKSGMFAWNGGYLLDGKALAWNQLKITGKMPGGGVDSSGLVYDPKRDRMLLVTLGGYGRPFDGQVHALDMATLAVAPLNPEGMNPSGKWNMFLREVAYHPASDLFLWPQRVNMDGKGSPDLFVAYDAEKNRWVTVKLAFNQGDGQPNTGNTCGIHWDARRGIFWLGDSAWNGAVRAMRFDPAQAEIKPLKDYVPPAPAPAPAAEKK